MRVTVTALALLLHHDDATADKASKAPAKGSKKGKGKSGKGTAAPTGVPTEGPTAAPTGALGTAAPTGGLCTSANSFINTSLRKAVADYFSQGCPTEPNCETILQYGVIGGWKNVK